MMSRYLRASYKMALIGVLSLTFSACNKDSSQQRRGQVAGAVPTSIGANGLYVRGNNIKCNVNDTNPNSPTSPYNAQSPCVQPSMIQQAQAAGQIPGAPQQQQQQAQVGPNGQPINPGLPPNGNPPNVSIDITQDGKIIKRNFRLVGGVGQEEVTDNCHFFKLDATDIHAESENPEENTKGVSRFLFPQYDRFEMFFDEDGNLSVAAQSINGQAYSVRSNPIPYTLNAGDQTISVEPFNIAGPASTQFVQNEKAVAQRFGTNEVNVDKALYDVQGGTEPGGSGSSMQAQNNSSPGFVLGPQAGTNNPSGGYRSLPMNPIIETPATTALSIPGFTAKILTWFVQPQHITEIRIPEIPFQSKTFVTAKPDVCQGNGHGRYLDLHLQPTQ
jgi:hypothetical protein